MKCPFLFQKNIQPEGKTIGKNLSEKEKKKKKTRARARAHTHTHTCIQLVTCHYNKEETSLVV